MSGVRGMSALPHGVAGVHALPADHHDGPWDAVLIDPAVKERLLATAVLEIGRAHV